MSTPAISNVLNSIMPTPQGGKADAQSTDGAFNQVLSREISNQNRNGNTTPSETAQGKKDGANADKTAKNDTPAADGSKPAENTKTSEDDKAAQAADGKTADKDDDTKTDPATTASAEILAFVNALTQSAAGGKATPADAANDIKNRIAGLGDGKGGSKIDPTMLGGGLPVASGEKIIPTGKQPDFAAALDKATTGAASDKDGKTAAASSGAKSAEADIAAAAQAVKAMEPAASTPQNLAAVAVATTAALQQHVNEMQDPQSNKLLPQVGTDDWGQALGQKISWMVQGAQQTATLTLNPPDLGPMQVVVHVNNNQATANFTAHQPEVRQALEAAMPRLREMLNESGIQLGQSNVSAGLPNQQNNASGDQRQNGRSSNQGSNAVETAAVNVSHIPISSAGNGIVDTFA